MSLFLTSEELAGGLAHVKASPRDQGQVKAIVIRPEVDDRVSLEQCELSPALGVQGDRWAETCKRRLANGDPDPEQQIAVMNAHMIDLLVGDKQRWPLAGDNLFVDMDLSRENLEPGQRLAVGTTVLQVSEHPHNGCKKFTQRFGEDAIQFISTPEGKQLRLRGIYMRVIQAGVIKVGDPMEKM